MDVFYVIRRIVERGGMAVVLGAPDTGKSSFCRMAAEVAVRAGRRVADLDADIGQTTVGPPGTVGLKFIASDEDLAPEGLNETFSLVDNAGGQFAVSGSSLVVAGALSAGPQQVIVRDTDSGGLTFDKTITITVNSGALVVGTAGPDTLVGTSGDDTIQGTFSTRGRQSAGPQTGTWRVKRAR